MSDGRILGNGLEAIFRPCSIAVIGASSDHRKTGGRPVHLLKMHGFQGRIMPVNPKGGEIQGLPGYTGVADLPETPDLALIAVPGAGALEAAKDCAARGVPAVIVLSAGFAEQGPEGVERQRELRAVADRTGMRVLGPNCLGTVSVPEKAIGTFSVALETEMPSEGPVAIVSQSGNVGSLAMKMLGKSGAGISRFLASGNECDVDIADAIAWLANDEATRVILCCLETCRDADRLTGALDMARAAGKPVIVLKMGSSDAGKAAALSHTGGLAGYDRVFDAIFARHGAVRVRSLEMLVQLGSAVSALGDRRVSPGASVSVIAASGGFGIMMADAAEESGLSLNRTGDAAIAKILDVLPLASPVNPVDATAQMSANPETFGTLLEAVVTDDANEIAVIMMALGLEVPRLREVYLSTLDRVRKAHPDRVIAACVAGPDDALAILNGMGIVTFPTIAATMQGIAHLGTLSATRDAARATKSTVAPAPLDRHAVRNEAGAKAALTAAGIAFPREETVITAEAAAAAARDMGTPVAMKILSAQIQHKSDIGGVELGVTADDAAAAFTRIMQAAADKAPGAQVDGVLVAPMIQGGTELILGSTTDPIFGPVVMVGLGGIYAEVFRDTALRIAPVTRDEAFDMLRELQCFPLLDGARGQPRADIDSAAQAIVALSEFAVRHAGDVAETDINPLLVRAEGEGAVALDALIVTHPETNAEAAE
ncbi:6-carboxyhexanoate--CoA ligase [Oceanicola sp. 22II-s10i]|uniref:acetate--CoA ligase family protein n=1 Tax=Oceanicola sp. 22II-s10i TaxID=1317116 RepID=UPI000B520D69|nr:acetate--CoA ligase family protein [Oceanicola sp. 22II-s10i]OWU84513.1 6-carboxyhexanoate--CoA ligase [Oceanicola sp. 22II-s10i]